MGSKSFDADALLAFLRSVECRYLYLVGDIIDGWKLKKRWHWTESCNTIIDELIRKRENGTQIIYLPGNHDDEIRHIMPPVRSHFARHIGLTIQDKVIHRAADGKRYVVLHGDQFDHALLNPLAKWSDRVYDAFIDMINGHRTPHVQINGSLKPFSLAKALNKHGARALSMLNNFETSVRKTARKHDAQGVICGHTHIATIKSLRGITYANCGSWLRTGHTALIEDFDGKLQLIDCPASNDPQPVFPAFFDQTNNTIPYVRLNAVSARRRREALAIVKMIYNIWHPAAKRPRILSYAGDKHADALRCHMDSRDFGNIMCLQTMP